MDQRGQRASFDRTRVQRSASATNLADEPRTRTRRGGVSPRRSVPERTLCGWMSLRVALVADESSCAISTRTGRSSECIGCASTTSLSTSAETATPTRPVTVRGVRPVRSTRTLRPYGVRRSSAELPISRTPPAHNAEQNARTEHDRGRGRGRPHSTTPSRKIHNCCPALSVLAQRAIWRRLIPVTRPFPKRV